MVTRLLRLPQRRRRPTPPMRSRWRSAISGAVAANARLDAAVAAAARQRR